ncbi:MAG: hypothetical protein KC656_05335 [Myxococcales bacterium]|nr:hypothetical protein [Myxococcales bacterium]MCB9668848.1 hypothetical protein [Alphaproteobacteria bacterium]MCB9691174.1 hypothetical protein [Alphaproteobacteria bacterium]
MVEEDVDPGAADPGILPKIAGVLQVVAGATAFTQGVQLLTMFIFYDWKWVLPYALVPLGLLQMAFGGWTSLGRDWGAIGGVGVTWFLALFAVVFTGWSLLHGVIVLALAWTALAGLAALVAPFAVPPSLAASRARRALYG